MELGDKSSIRISGVERTQRSHAALGCRSRLEFKIWQYNRTPPMSLTMTDKEKRSETILSEFDLTSTFDC